jgi:fructose-1,6-bisphosphatase/inositol monophosphatase family enzyme
MARWHGRGTQMENMAMVERDDIIAVAHALADAARKATLAHFRSLDLAADNKESLRFDPVTVADRDSEQASWVKSLAASRAHRG